MPGCHILLVAGLALIPGLSPLKAGNAPAWERTEDVIYGRKDGMALTLDVFTPKHSNGAGVIFAVSGGWVSAHDGINGAVFSEFLNRGYTVFAVVHGSQPRYTIPEVIKDMQRAVRFIRYKAARFHVDPERIVITGGSAGGHLALMIATAGGPGRSGARDPVDRVSSRVKAAACWFPPTDFLNWGEPGRDVFKALEGELAVFKAPFDFKRFDSNAHRFLPITDSQEQLKIARAISPVTHVTPDDPPVLIFHGDEDKLVPIQQSLVMQKALQEAHVPVKLVIKPGAGHGWPEWTKDMSAMADWFDTYLTPTATSTSPH